MKKANTFGCFVLLLIAVAAIAVKYCIFIVDERSQFIVTRFGEAVGEPITEAGLHFKTPWEKANQFPKQVLEWDGQVTEMSTKDKTYISVDTYGRWRIVDARAYFGSLREERSAQSRLDDILGSETRKTIAKHELIETIRTTKDRKPAVSEELVEADLTGNLGKFKPIRFGRALLEKEIFDASKSKLKELGIELLDVRFKRINYNSEVRLRIYDRMISERQQIAERFRSEGAGEASKILGNMEKELAEIESAAYRESEIIKGEADAKATEIYSKAYGSSDDSAEFYEFVKTMSLYETMFSDQSTVIMSTDSDIFKYLKSVDPLQRTSKPNPVVKKARETAPPVSLPQ